MSASEGTPTIEQQIAAELGFGPAIGMTPDEIAATKQGVSRELQQATQTVLSLFSPILGRAETTGLGDLANFLKAVLGALPTVTSLSQAHAIITGALDAEAGPLKAQAVDLGQSALVTLVSAALAAVGKINVPIT